MHVDTVQDSLFLGKIGTRERKAGRNSASVHIATDLELVSTLGHGTVHALLLLGAGDFAENHLLAEEGFDFVLNET